jgi:hypothetical protein
MQEIHLPNNWRPRDYQIPAWTAAEEGILRHALVWHRRAGKDDFALHRGAVECHKRVGTYWHMLPEYGQARKAIWEAVNPHSGMRRIDEAFPPELRETTRENDMTIKFKNGSFWHVVGSDNFNSLVGSPPAGCVFSEWALAKPEAWAYLRPILAENGGWATFIYTPRGPNHGLRTYEHAVADPEWFGQILTVEDTDALDKDILLRERREYVADWGRDMGEALYDQEYMCSFEAAIVGSIYGGQLALARSTKRITNVPHDPAYPVGTMWDLGFTDSTAIWFYQIVGQAIHFIDYYEGSNAPLEFYANMLRQKGQDLKYEYGRNMNFFPHDVEAHELQTGKSRVQTLWELGIKAVVASRHSPWDGINTVRRLFHRFYFDVKKCDQGLSALSTYRREWNEKNRTFDPNPVHDWSSHSADALRTGCALINMHMPRTLVPEASDYGRKGKRRWDEWDRPHSWMSV